MATPTSRTAAHGGGPDAQSRSESHPDSRPESRPESRPKSRSVARSRAEATGPARSWPPALGTLALLWVMLASLVVGFGWLLTHPLAGSVGDADDDLALWFADRRTPTLDDLATAGAFLGDTMVGQVGLIALAVGFALWTRSFVPAVFVGLLEAGLLGIYMVATHLVPRDRPPVRILDPGLVPDHSFPSGHVATATAVYGGIFVLAWTFGRVTPWLMAPLLLLPLVVVVSRMYQGAHHLSDVLTSLVYAPVWLATVTMLLLWGGSRHPDQADSRG